VNRPTWLLPNWDTLTEFPSVGVARQLGALVRYAGATPDHYSVARHSLLVSALLPADPALQLLGLVHDAHECWTGDILRPASARVKFALKELQDEIDRKLWALLGLDPDPASLALVATADNLACQLELRLLGRPQHEIQDELPAGHQVAAWHLAFHSNSKIDATHWRVAIEDARKVIV
jgi:hypothetical protein